MNSDLQGKSATASRLIESRWSTYRLIGKLANWQSCLRQVRSEGRVIGLLREVNQVLFSDSPKARLLRL